MPIFLEPLKIVTLPATAGDSLIVSVSFAPALIEDLDALSDTFVAWALTVSECAAEVDVQYPPPTVGTYFAFSLSTPPGRVFVDNDALPFLAVTVFSTFDPSRNSTLPGAAAGVTVALNVTLAPYTTDFEGYTVSFVVVALVGACV